MAMKSNDWTGITLSDGRYAVTAKLGEGGMGMVYRARDTRLGMDVVIKAPRQAMLDDPEFGGRFAREIRSLVKLSHPCIVKVTDVGQQDGLPFAIMQYLSGGSLEDRLVAPSGQAVVVDPKTVPGWLQGVASALDYVHAQGYVHRDVKPGNILFDSQGYSFLGDFGVIKALAATEGTKSKTVTGAGLVLGTPEYMAPELIMGGKVDGRADQYALAVTVYEALCGRRPFEGSSPTAVLVLQTTQPPVPLTEVRPNLSDRLSRAVLKGLAKDPSQRHANCAALAAAVVAALEASPDFAPGGSAPNPASSESVKILCPSCGKKISVVGSIYSTLKRTGKSFTCPGCHQPVQVASERTKVLSAPPRDPGSSRSGTQILPATGPAEASEPVPAVRSSRTTEKIEVADAEPIEGYELSPRLDRAKTQIVGRTQTQLVPQIEESDQQPEAPSRLQWIVMGAIVSLFLIAVLAYKVLTSGSGEAVVASPENTASVPDVEDREIRPQEPESLETASADSPLPATTPAPGNNLKPTAPSVGPTQPAAVPPTNVASIPSPTPAPPPVLKTAVAAGNSGAAPDSVASASINDDKPDDSPPNLADNPKVAANKFADKQGDPPALEEILADPEKYGDQEIAPKGLFRVSKILNYGPDGTPTMAVIQGGLTVKQTGPQMFTVIPIEGGKISTLEVERAVADRFIANHISYRGTVSSLTRESWQKNLACLTLRVLRSAGMSRGTGWICRIVKAEFLINLDGQRIGEHKPGRAFQTYKIAQDAEGLVIGNGDEWQKRLGTRFIADIGKVARLFKAQRSIARQNATGAVIANAVNQSIANANAASEAARHGAMLPRPVPNGSALFNAEVRLNAELVR